MRAHDTSHARSAVASSSFSINQSHGGRYQACNVTGHAGVHGDDLQLLAPTQLDTDGTGADMREVAKGEAVHVWETASLRHAFAPVLVCKDPHVTVGLGDAISSAAFSAHLQ